MPSLPAAERQARIQDHLGLVRHAARRYRGWSDYEDILQAGTIGLIHAVDHYDPAQGTSFSSYAVPSITGAIKHHLRDRSATVRIPGRLQELAARVSGSVEEQRHRLGRSPTIAEIAEALAVSTDEVLEAIEADHARVTVSTSAEDSPVLELGGADEQFERVEMRESVRQALGRLPVLERQILDLRYYQDCSQSTIADRLGITQMQVSRILRRASQQLREELAEV